MQFKRIGKENPSVLFTKSVTVNAMGVVHITGSSLDKRGSFARRADVDPEQAIVLAARIVVEDKGREVYSKIHQFTYFTGD